MFKFLEQKERNYLLLILVHAVLGVLIYYNLFISKIYGILIFVVSLYFIIKTRNRNNEVLYASAYLVGSEVFLRMTEGNPNHEFSKYGIILYVTIGMIYSGFSKNAIPYWIFLILLVPGLILGAQELDLTTQNIRKTLAFNISGPICLGITSLYCYNRKLTFPEMNNILLMVGLPMVACSAYLWLFTPELKEVLTGTGSNGETSGGFGPNQVSTALGLGMFVFLSRLFVASKTKVLFVINLVVAQNISYRGLVTFSRGGMITGFAMLVILFAFMYLNSSKRGRFKMFYFGGIMAVILTSVWFYTEVQTGGLIGLRYANKDALGREKESKFTGREEIAESEINAFLDNPFFGVGVAKGTEIRLTETGQVIASHNEITRMLGEHGFFGLLGLVLLILTPSILFLGNRQHVYAFCFVAFWLLTINHAAMRTAAPSFIYALSLLKVYLIDPNEITLHREQTV